MCTSTAMMQELTAHGIERVELWQRGVDTELFHPELACQQMRSHLSQGYPESPCYFMWVVSAEKKLSESNQC